MTTTTTTTTTTDTITITLHVDAAASVRACSGACGPRTLRLDAAALASLTDDQREGLALHVAGSGAWAAPLTRDAPPIGVADLPTLAALLDTRRALVLAQDEAAAAQAAADLVAISALVDELRALPIAEVAAWYLGRHALDRATGCRATRAAAACDVLGIRTVDLPHACSVTAEGIGRAGELAEYQAAQDAALFAWLAPLRSCPVLEIPGDVPEVHRAAASRLARQPGDARRPAALVGRADEWDAARVVAREAARVVEVEASASVLDLVDPVLAALHRAGESRPAEVTRTIRRWIRATTQAPALPHGWRGNGNADDQTGGVAVEAARAAVAWAAHVEGITWPAGVTARVRPSFAWRPAAADEIGDRDGEVATPTVAIVVELGPDEIAVHVDPSARPPVAVPGAAERAATQRRIADAVRAADPIRVETWRQYVTTGACMGDGTGWAILAASLDPVIADALRQVAQVAALDGAT